MTGVYNFKGELVGNVEGDTYYTERKPNMYMVKYKGFGISLSILEKLKEMGVKIIKIKYYGVRGIQEFRYTLDEYQNSPNSYNYHDVDIQKFPQAPTFTKKEVTK